MNAFAKVGIDIAPSACTIGKNNRIAPTATSKAADAPSVPFIAFKVTANSAMPTASPASPLARDSNGIAPNVCTTSASTVIALAIDAMANEPPKFLPPN